MVRITIKRKKGACYKLAFLNLYRKDAFLTQLTGYSGVLPLYKINISGHLLTFSSATSDRSPYYEGYMMSRANFERRGDTGIVEQAHPGT